MTAKDLSDSVRRRTTPHKPKQHRQGSDSDALHSTTAKNMVPTTKSPTCCKQNKAKIIGTVIGIALAVGLLSSIIVVITYYYNSGAVTGDSCLNFVQIKTCLATDSSPYRRYGTKTDYTVAKTEVEAEIGAVAKAECKAVHFYLLSRHAVRYPDKADIEEMAVRLPELRERMKNSTLCIQDLESLKQWSLQMKPEDDNQVTATGKQQAQEIAQRYLKMFPTLLSGPYIPTLHEFLVTSKPRTRDTAEAFVRGLYGKDAPIKEIKFPVNDYLLHFNQNCSQLLQARGYVKKKSDEVTNFQNGRLMKLQLSDLSRRLGFTVTFSEAEIMFRACAFDFAINKNKSSPWCSVFTKSDIRVFEYYNDLDDYYDDAYGNPRNYKQACPIIKDLAEVLRKAKEGGRPRKALMYFSHAGVIKKVLANMGLYQDSSDLKAEGFCFNQGRKWRSSILCPFNSNLAIVLYNCGERYSVEAYLQEKPVTLGGCKRTLCPWADFEKRYVTPAECDLQKICVP